jgi:PAS domain S-box-containing protein
VGSTPSQINSRQMGYLRSVQDRLAWQEAELEILHQVRMALTETGNIQQIITRTVIALTDLLGYSHVGAYLVVDGELHLVHQIGFLYPVHNLKLSAGICGRVATTGRAVHLPDVRLDPGYLAANDGIESEICVPFGTEQETRGVLNVESSSRAPLSDRDFRLVQEVGHLLSLAIERSELATKHVTVEKRLEAALDAASMGAWTWTIPTDGWDWTFGERTDDPVRVLQSVKSTADLRRFVHAADVAYIDNAFRLMILSGDLDVDFRLSIDAGAPVWLNLRGHAIDWAGPEMPVRSAGVVTDISGRKRLEDERIRLTHMETERINAEVARREMEVTIGRLTDGFIATDPELSVTLMNEPAAQLLECDREQAIGRTLLEAIAQFADARGRKQLLDSALAPLPSNFDIYDAQNGRFVFAHIYPGTGGVTIYLRDVTKLRQVEFERQMIESRFQSLVQQASDLTIVFDRRGQITYCSPASERILGYTPKELETDARIDMVHPADRKRLRRAFIRLVRKHGTGLPIELRLMHKDGTLRWIEATPSNLLTDASVRGLVANCRDVTDRHATEFNLWLTSEIASVIGASLDERLMLDGLNRLLTMYVSHCSAIAIQRDGLVETFRAAWRDSDIQTQDEISISPELIALLLDRPIGPPNSPDYSWIDIDRLLQRLGTEADFSFLELLKERGAERVYPVGFAILGEYRGILLVGARHEAPFSVGEIALIQDAARRIGLALTNVDLYAQAQEAVATRDRFLSVAAHELRTPITSVAGYTEMLQKEMANRRDPERIERYVNRLDDAGARLKVLAEDLLDVSRMRTDSLQLRNHEVDFSAEVARIVRAFADRGEQDPERVSIVSTGDPRTVHGDRERLSQVISNLAGNALKYSQSPAPIHILLDYQKDSLVFSVMDEGIGVDLESLDDIFEPFGRSPNAVASNVPGLGLGLYICKSIVIEHGGVISAKSDGPGKGLTVSVTLPYDH